MAQVQETFLFTPTSLPGCLLWLDAADRTTIDRSGSSISAWRDKSGNGKNITIAGTGGLSFGNSSGNVGAANSVNTVPGLTSYFTVAVDIRKTVLPNMTLFAVYAWLGRTTNTAQTFWGNDAPNSANRVQFFDFSSVFNTNSYGYFLNNGYLYNATELNRSTTQIYELVSQVGVASGTGVYFNGTLGTAGLGSELVNTPAAGNDILYFGGGETSSIYPSYTQFNEIIIYNTALNPTQRQQVEGYLAWKWGLISLLAANHPFKTYRTLANPPIPTSVPPMPLDIENVTVFNPLSFSGCLLWLDARDSSTLTTTSGTGTLATFVQASPTTSTVTTSTTVPSLFSLASGTCFMNGTFINSSAGRSGFLSPRTTIGDMFAFCYDSLTCKVVSLRFTLSGGVLSVTATGTGFGNTFLQLTNNPAQNEAIFATYTTSVPIATSAASAGYGVANFSLNFASVSEWRDKSPNAWNFANATAANQPTYSAIGMNGLPSLRFSTSWLSRTNTGTAGSTTYTVFFMVNTQAIPGGGGAGYFLDVNTGRLVFGDNNIGGAGNPIGTGMYNGVSPGWTTFAPIQTGIQLFSYVCTPGGALYRNGTFVGSFPTFGSIALNGTLAVGANRVLDGGTPYNGTISEILMYNSVLSTTQRQQVERYLAWKYNTSPLLAAGPPYSLGPLAPFAYPITPFICGLSQWLPTQIPNTQLWLDASVPSLFTLSPGTTTVTAVTDRNTPGKTITVGNTVTYTAPTAINFTDSTGVFNVAGMPSSPFDYFFVGRALSSTTNWRTMLRSSVNGSATHQFLLQTGGNAAGMWTGSAFSQFGSLTMLPNEQAMFYGSMAANNTIQASKNGTIALTAASSAGLDSAIGCVGSSVGGSQPFGELQELVVYSGTLTTNQRQQVEGYLAWKWGLQGTLPLQHPFKFFPPSP